MKYKTVMKKFNFIKAFSNSSKQLSAAVLVVAAVALVMGISVSQSHAAGSGGTLTLSPASGSYSVGDTITLSISENSGSTPVNAVEADISYPSSLQYVSYSVANSNFNSPGPVTTTSGGAFKIAMLDTSSLTGSEAVADVSFKVISDTPSTAVLSFLSTSAVVSDGSNINATTSGASFTLSVPSCPTGQTGVPPNCVTPSCPTGQTGVPPNCVDVTVPNPVPPTPAPSSGGSSGSTVTTTSSGSSSTTGTNITPTGSTTPVSVPNNSSVQVSAPASVEPTEASTSPSTIRVEYFLNSKLLATISTAPFTYKLDTTNILNGNYTFTTKTYYNNGKVTSTTQEFIVKNPRSFTQVKLAAQQYAGPAASVLILFVIGFVLLFRGHDFARAINKMLAKFHSKKPPTSGSASGSDSNNPVSPPPTIVSPSEAVTAGAGPASFVPSSSQSQSPGSMYIPNPPSDSDNRL